MLAVKEFEFVAAAIIIEASLTFLAIGVRPPAPEWGSMLRSGYGSIEMAPGHLHSRTEFLDGPEPHQKRHLLRRWLKFSKPWPIAPRFFEHHGYTLQQAV